jgi:sterol desaturase/sphingolipid hydroxylase (fatty acid hydroxylase superfamily)
MRFSAKTIGVFAAAPACVLAGLACAWHELPLSSLYADDTLQFIYAFSFDVLKAVGSTAFGRLGVVVALVLVAEIFFVGWRGSSLFRLTFIRSKSAVVDALNFVLALTNSLVFLQIAFTLGASLITAKFIAWVSSHYGWSRVALPSHGIIEIAESFVIFWLITSFVQYWGHRLMHTPLFWHVHRFHHAATELNMVTNFRQHPLESVAVGFFSLVSPLIFFDVPKRVLLVYFFIASVTELLAHSQLPWGYGWVGRWVVQSPRFHQVHHSAEDEHQNLHFSNCPLWDRMFGTWYEGTKQPSKFGIADPAYELQPFRTFVLDAWTFYASIGRWCCSLPRKLGITSADPPPAIGMGANECSPHREGASSPPANDAARPMVRSRP